MLKKIIGVLFLAAFINLINVSAQTDQVKSIKKGIVNGSAVSLPKPEFPAAARAVGASGAVNVQVLIDENGNVVSATAVSGHPLLRQSAEQAAQTAQFKPTLLSGQTVRVIGIIAYNFVPPSSVNKTAEDSEKKVQNEIVIGRITNLESSSSSTNTAIVNDLATDLVKPDYPAAARAIRASGTVNVKVTIDENGNIESAEAISGHPLLQAAGINAAYLSKFKPTILSGQAVKVSGIIVYKFLPPATEKSSTEETPLQNSSLLKIMNKSVLNGKAISLPKPDYPLEAKSAKAGGVVSVQVLIDEQGNVESANAVSGHELLFATSEKAARGAKFSPTLLEGVPVKVQGVIVYNFVP